MNKINNNFLSYNFLIIFLIPFLLFGACRKTKIVSINGVGKDKNCSFNNKKGFPVKYDEETERNMKDPAYKQYIDFFEKVYDTMEKNYYQPVSRNAFNRFLKVFNSKIYSQLKRTGKSVDFIRWRSAAYLVDYLKSPEDIFSAFYPPKPAKKYERTALGLRVDLGIKGRLTDEGYKIIQVEPRSDTYSKGMRRGDLLLRIDGVDVKTLSEREIEEKLTPLLGSHVNLEYKSLKDGLLHKITVVSKKYFKQTVFLRPIPIPGIYCLQIQRFNKKTADDLLRFLQALRARGFIKGLILDLRGNPGGPPLAAMQISSFFLKGGDEFAYFQKRGEKKAELIVPSIPDKYHYDGAMVILVDRKSGSAAELFSGVLQKCRRAVLMGTHTAGQVMLKSMFHFEDGSMLLLVIARGHFPDGSVFSFSGLNPDRSFDNADNNNLIIYAAKYLSYISTKK